jgi:hypothetical protein
MIVLADTEDKIYGAVAIEGPRGFASPFRDVLFPCLIWDHDGHFTDSERSAVARALLEAGCRYAVCGGESCEAWHDAVDREFIQLHLDDPDEVCEAAHVMTTWHDGESPEDVAFFFVLNTNFDDHDFRRYLVLHVGTGKTKEQVDAAVRAYALNKKAV